MFTHCDALFGGIGRNGEREERGKKAVVGRMISSDSQPLVKTARLMVGGDDILVSAKGELTREADITRLRCPDFEVNIVPKPVRSFITPTVPSCLLPPHKSVRQCQESRDLASWSSAFLGAGVEDTVDGLLRSSIPTNRLPSPVHSPCDDDDENLEGERSRSNWPSSPCHIPFLPFQITKKLPKMRWLPTLLTTALLAAAPSLAASKKSPEERFKAFHAKSLSSTPVKLSDPAYRELTSSPRDYTVAVLLTAMDARYGCQLCREFQPEWELLSKSWIGGDKAGESRLVFGTLDFTDGRDIFMSVGGYLVECYLALNLKYMANLG